MTFQIYIYLKKIFNVFGMWDLKSLCKSSVFYVILTWGEDKNQILWNKNITILGWKLKSLQRYIIIVTIIIIIIIVIIIIITIIIIIIIITIIIIIIITIIINIIDTIIIIIIIVVFGSVIKKVWKRKRCDK